jgi:hypothetical protein
MMENAGRPRQRIGAWRLLDIVTATMPLRSGSFAAAGAMPEFGPPDAIGPLPEPTAELPDSNIDDHQQRAAVAREAMRRKLGSRS